MAKKLSEEPYRSLSQADFQAVELIIDLNSDKVWPNHITINIFWGLVFYPEMNKETTPFPAQ
ncbi:hypothetical protein KIN20_023195 [Parelaphostrongylus tenuis]|uniref:Uncharacterized protein n=1 Tax=Parelaphostrongylus tenuis TaxID=148309 RepID=A0AAD5MWH6_PARTN|nr:hypothetical protein KIN20_023195 [Parelaphostrongylus tenuis]